MQYLLFLAVKQIMEFSRAQPRLTPSYFFNKSNNCCRLSLPDTISRVLLIPGLPAVPKKLTNTADRQLFGLRFREDFPGCFFTMLTP